MVGDVHGSWDSFLRLLSKLSYDPAYDHLIHVGDIIAKGPHKGSLAVLDYMTQHNVTGVRGNHDQKVIEWRAWRDWIRGISGGTHWLQQLDQDADSRLSMQGKVSAKWIEKELVSVQDAEKWRKRIPAGWELFSDHYNLARKMTASQYDYLLSLPLVLHIPSAHTFIVHAGLLPYDPTRSQNNHRQPLSHLPIIANKGHKGKGTTTELRRMQELAVLHEIPQNTDPWAKINIRSVDRDEVTKDGKIGTPWSDLWNDAMKLCGGDDALDLDLTSRKGDSMPCWPSTVVYGHAASRGLDVKRWSIGTDSGCVYGRRLSAFVLDSHSRNALDSEDDIVQDLVYGDSMRGRIVSVSCH
ncbi:Metallo-dependent phosphatase [Athelia psychrophila]|uniref:Metallo-dependent phosphatase n=1 Tax=Athelia psychrophila TaxID=1759441 RepID=A0A167U1T2_9AGAM|nr:Metallo-dependent phosphatase [Fibularhizoctonia sp. CBS 109695]